MRWSVAVEAEGDRVLTREEIVELADAVAAQQRHRLRHRHDRATAPSWSSRPTSRDEAIERGHRGVRRGRGARPGCRRGRSSRAEAISEDDDDDDLDDGPDDPARLAGRLPVRGAAGARPAGRRRPGPRSTRSCTSPSRRPSPSTYAVIYVGHSDDLSAERFPFRHPRAACWVRRAGSRWKVYICTYEVPGGLRVAPRADRPGARARSTTRAATSSSTTRRGRTSGSASTPRRPPARSPPAATPAAEAEPRRRAPDRRLGSALQRRGQPPAGVPLGA